MNVAAKTPLEVAQYMKNQQIINLLNDFNKQKATQRKYQEYTEDQRAEDEIQKQAEAVQRVEALSITSDECKQILNQVTGKTESEVIQMMRRGEIPVNMWSAVWSRCSESQQILPELRKEQAETSTQLANVREQIIVLQQKEKDLEQRLNKVEQTLSTTIIPPQVLASVETLSIAEQSEMKHMKSQLKEEKENTVLSINEIGFFLNASGMARISRKLHDLAEHNEMTEMSLVDMGTFVRGNVSTGNRADIQFAIDMIRHGNLPPYDTHTTKCPVCSSSVADLLEEYQIEFDQSALAKLNLSSSALSFLKYADLVQLLVKNTNAEQLRTVKAIKTMRRNHINFLTT